MPGLDGMTVLEALLYPLAGDSNIQQRCAQVLPTIQKIEGEGVLDRLEKILLPAENGSLARGTSALAAGQLIFNLLRSGRLSSGRHRLATLLLQKAALATENRRPLYRLIGGGNGHEDPVTIAYAGELDDELASLVARLS
jgi:hypothetical protein